MRRILTLAIVLAPALLVAQQQDLSKVEVKATKVAGTVYMLTGSGGNIGVSAGEDGIVIIDDEFAPLAPKIIGTSAQKAGRRHVAQSSRGRKNVSHGDIRGSDANRRGKRHAGP